MLAFHHLILTWNPEVANVSVYRRKLELRKVRDLTKIIESQVQTQATCLVPLSYNNSENSKQGCYYSYSTDDKTERFRGIKQLTPSHTDSKW